MALDKDWIKDHKKEIIVGGVMTIISVAGGVYIYKLRDSTNDMTQTIAAQNLAIAELRDSMCGAIRDKDTLMDAASEGLFEEAIATVTRKINYKKDRIEFLEQQLARTPDDIDARGALQRLVDEVFILTSRKDKFLEAQRAYNISAE